MEEMLEQFIIEVLADPVRTKVLCEVMEQEGFYASAEDRGADDRGEKRA